MKQNWIKISLIALVAVMMSPLAALAQKEDKDKSDKDKEVKEKKEVQQVIVTRKGDKDEKVVIEINGDKVKVNGKSLEEYRAQGGDISVHTNNWKDPESLFRKRATGVWSTDADNIFTFMNEDENRAMLGVTTQKADEGVEIQQVTKESGAEKAGLKEKDIITKVDGKKIEEPDDLSKVIKEHKAGDKVSITYLRDKKEATATAELSKWKGAFSNNFKMDLDKMNFEPKIRTTPGTVWSYTGGNPKLGLSVQDSDDGKGVKVISVDDESNAAKAGIKEDDVITEVDGKAINNADDMVKVIRESKEKISINIKLSRAGKNQNIDVKMPRKLKSANL
jgi:serine protease Do